MRQQLLRLLAETANPAPTRGNPRARRRFLIFVAVCVVVMTTGLLAAWFPALRAAAIEPMQALRMD